MTIYVVRHARAGSRQRWKKDDRLRPLSRVGRAQADGIARRLEREPVDRIISSPYARCLGTVEPIAEQRHVRVEFSDALAEGARPELALPLFEKLLDQNAVLCTHGDVVRDLLDHFGRHGVKLKDHRMEKGSIWVFQATSNQITRARYIGPPKAS